MANELQELFLAMAFIMTTQVPHAIASVPKDLLKRRTEKLGKHLAQFKIDCMKAGVSLNSGAGTDYEAELGDKKPHISSYFGVCVAIICLVENAIKTSDAIANYIHIKLKKNSLEIFG